MGKKVKASISLLFPEEPFVEADILHNHDRGATSSLLFPEEPFVEATGTTRATGATSAIAPLSRGALR